MGRKAVNNYDIGMIEDMYNAEAAFSIKDTARLLRYTSAQTLRDYLRRNYRVVFIEKKDTTTMQYLKFTREHRDTTEKDLRGNLTQI